jgi:hypothetical protein
VTRIAAALRGFASFWWDFIVGDDWRIAAGVVVALGVTAWSARTGMASWWIVPVAVAGLLALSLRSAIRKG